MRHSRPKLRRTSLLLVAALAVPLILTGCSITSNHTPLNPVSGPAHTVNRLWWIMFGMAVGIQALITILVIAAIIRFRSRPGDTRVPAQVHGNTRIEVAWTIAPAMVLVVLLVLTLTTMIDIAQPKDVTMRVTVTGHQWWWEFEYQGQNVVTGNELHIPINTPVHFDLRSADVIHSFWVPNLGGKRDAIPGHDNSLWLESNQTGTFRGECTEFCGAEHANMNFIVVVQTQDDFNSWLRGQQQPAMSVTTGLSPEQIALVNQGAQTILTQACAGCHTIRGLPNYEVGKVGPDLTHVGSREYLAAGTIENTPENMARWIRNPQDIKPDTKMPTLGLDDQTIAQITAYLQSLK
jgi:cytochrome c oxidase subunit 2